MYIQKLGNIVQNPAWHCQPKTDINIEDKYNEAAHLETAKRAGKKCQHRQRMSSERGHVAHSGLTCSHEGLETPKMPRQ
jgi:hypothetical protein